MTTNPFEQYVDDVTASRRPVHDLSPAEQLYRLNEERAQTHEGHSPLDLWGEEAAKLCSDFLEFAGRIATQSTSNEQCRYPIAYTTISTTSPTSHPEPDVFLYQDGLVRVGPDGQPLPLVDLNGRLQSPIFAKRTHILIHKKVWQSEISGSATYDTSYWVDEPSVTYTEEPVVDGLKRVLREHALALAAGPQQSK